MQVLPINHPLRLEALEDTQLLDSLPEESYDRFTRLACHILKAEVSLISLVAETRQFFKSQYGLGEPLRTTRQNDISYSFCRYVVEGGAPFIVEDAVSDPRVSKNPAVTELGIAAYLGIPISTPDGCILGSLCAAGTSPRSWSANDLRNLSDLAAAVCREIELSEQSLVIRNTLKNLEDRSQVLERDLRTTVHDLRTPAGAISSCLELISLNDDARSQETMELLDICQESTASLLDMLQQLLVNGHLKASQGQMLDIQSVSASQLLRRAARVTRTMANEAKVKLDLTWPDELIYLMVDERLIERVFLNLITNAIKFSPAGGSVRIRMRREGTPESPLCRISVIDHGPGVPDSEKLRIFEEFATGSNTSNHAQASFGIGLGFCKTVVDTHGGQIGVEDAPDGGSSFYCVLPALANG
ncbi:GAF domain-containing sensor histidine kinase [Luteolibacter yonseiensis]|uniref:histidine kinase n=1 Tax=Luteolibacter yonseiensis TaxID=1144680 RepID=A0A934R762_9BACT|nr:GAF domain-containing sensor histidine kinase [Luteolibacter yonseiensis]MBK1816349.1 GAF domain-containing sensor histidine kinase [Luteolibacter yonseiensis]